MAGSRPDGGPVRSPCGSVGKEIAWTKEEMRQYQNGPAALAAAVIKQWHKDGEPAACKKAISLWQKVYDEARSLKGE